MAKLNFALICGRSLIDQGTSLLSLIDIVEELSLTPPPAAAVDPNAVFPIQHPMDLVLDFRRSQVDQPETVRVRIVVHRPDGIEIGKSHLDLNMQTSIRCRGFVKMTGLPVTSPGMYRFDIQVLDSKDQWRSVSDVAFNVRFLTAAKT